MVMWKLKSCPRCGGDMFVDTRLEGWYEQCLQCSYRHDLKNVGEPREKQVQREKEPAGAAGL